MPVLLAVFAIVHVSILMLDLQRPDAFLRADRAQERLQAIEALQNSTGWTEISTFIGTHGNVGDYALHALLYSSTGRIGVIVFQVALLLLSSIGVSRLGRMIGLTPTASTIAAALYLSMPHSLVFPHQLVTEAIYVPLVIISTWMLCSALRRTDYRLLALAGLLLGVCTLIRPISLLWPAIVLALIGGFHRWHAGALFAAAAYLPVVLWMSVVNAYTGAYGLGESGHSMGRNLYLRVAAIAATLPEEQRTLIERQYLTESGRGSLSPARYLGFGIRHPVPFLRHIVRDAAIFFGKSGVERITVDYFANDRQFKSLTDSNAGWRTRLDREGPLATLRYLWETLGLVFAISLAGSVLLVTLIALSAKGALSLLKELRSRSFDLPGKITAALLITFPIYIFVFSLVVNGVQSRQRAPAEFAFIILAVYSFARARSPRAAATDP